jgi:dihydrofolate reductase
MISIIVAAAENNVIGNNNNLIWHLPADLKFFKETTNGNSIIMGRKTYESIGRPLPNRQNIIITRNTELQIDGVTIVNTLEEALEVAESEEKFICGGGQIYKEGIHLADKIYFTRIHQEFEGDTIFPEIDSSIWKEVSRKKGEIDQKNTIDYSILVFERKH